MRWDILAIQGPMLADVEGDKTREMCWLRGEDPHCPSAEPGAAIQQQQQRGHEAWPAGQTAVGAGIEGEIPADQGLCEWLGLLEGEPEAGPGNGVHAPRGIPYEGHRVPVDAGQPAGARDRTAHGSHGEDRKSVV